MMGKEKKKETQGVYFALSHDADFFPFFFGMITVACGNCELMNE